MPILIIYATKTRARFEIKFWIKCNASTYFVLRAFPYVGKKEREVGLHEHVTLSLMESHQNTGLNVNTENFFTSLSLARKLLQRNITIVCTVRTHGPEIPSEIQIRKSAPPEESLILLSCKAKKSKVVYLYCS